MGKKSTGSSGVDLDAAMGYVKSIEESNSEIEKAKSKYMHEAKQHRDDIKDVLKSAKSDGIPPAAIKAAVEIRKLEQKQKNVRSGMDLDVGSVFEEIMEGFDTTPLGKAAAAANANTGEAQQPTAH